jgi:hypothetical protein
MKIVIALWRLVAGRVIKLLRPGRRRLGWAALLPLVAVLYLTIWGVNAGTIVFIAIALAAALAIPVIAADLLPLALMAEGRSNSAIAQRLFISDKAVSKHCTSIYREPAGHDGTSAQPQETITHSN